MKTYIQEQDKNRQNRKNESIEWIELLVEISRDSVEIFLSFLIPHCNPLHTPFVVLFCFGISLFLGDLGSFHLASLLRKALKLQSRSNNMAAAAMGCVSVFFMGLIRHRMHYPQRFPKYLTVHMSIDQLELSSGIWLLLPNKQNSCLILQFFPFLVHLNKSKLGKSAKSIGFRLERTPTCHQFNHCSIFENQNAHDCSRDLFNPGGKWVTWSGKEEMYSSCGSIKHQNIHIIGAGAWKNVSDCCSRPQIVWQALAA